MARSVFLPHAMAAIIITAITGLIYVSTQQVYRTGANDPQIQMARDIAWKLQTSPVAAALPPDTVNLLQSLAPFVQVYNDSGLLITSTGFIYGKAPAVPAGVLAQARAKGEDAVTWQPEKEVRTALVIVYCGGRSLWHGYVLAGRSLWEVEKRESNLLAMVFVCWVACMGIICAHALLQAWLERKAKIQNWANG